MGKAHVVSKGQRSQENESGDLNMRQNMQNQWGHNPKCIRIALISKKKSWAKTVWEKHVSRISLWVKKKTAHFPLVLPSPAWLNDTTHSSLPAVTQSEVVHMLLTLERYISPGNEQEMYYSISERAELADFWIGILDCVLAKGEFFQIRKRLDTLSSLWHLCIVFVYFKS